MAASKCSGKAFRLWLSTLTLGREQEETPPLRTRPGTGGQRSSEDSIDTAAAQDQGRCTACLWPGVGSGGATGEVPDAS